MKLTEEKQLLSMKYDPSPYFKLCSPDRDMQNPQGYALERANGLTKEGLSTGFFSLVANVYDEDEKNYGVLMKYRTRMGSDKLMYLSLTDDFFEKLTEDSFYLKNDPVVLDAIKEMIHYPLTKYEYFVPYFSRCMYSKKFHGFSLPDGLYTKDGKKYIVYDNKNAQNSNVLGVSGSYDEWKSNIASHLVKYPIPTFALLVSFAALLYPFVNLGTIIVHFYGDGSRGKTALLQFAGSVFGRGSEPKNDNDASFLSTWSGTGAGLEAMASMYNGTVGLLDELHLIKDADFPQAIYSLCGGASKSRSKSNGKLQSNSKWRFPALSSGEESGFEKILKTKNPTLGQFVRFLDVPVTEQIFTEFNGELVLDKKGSEALASHLKNACSLHYGHAGRDFMTQLLNLADNHEQLQSLVAQQRTDIFNHLCSVELKQEEMRVMHHFALFVLAGYLAVDFGILPLEKADVLNAVVKMRDLWCKNKQSNQSMALEKYNPQKDYVSMLRQGIIKDVHSYGYTTDLKIKGNCKGFLKCKRYGQEMNAYLLYPKTFEDIFSGCDLKEVCEKLSETGFLLRDKDQYKRLHRIAALTGNNGGSARVALYTIDSSIIEASVDEITIDDFSDDELDMAMDLIRNQRKSNQQATEESLMTED